MIYIYRNVKKDFHTRGDHKPCTGVLTLAPVLDSVVLSGTLKQCDASKYLSPAVKTRLAALCCVHLVYLNRIKHVIHVVSGDRSLLSLETFQAWLSWRQLIMFYY